MQNPYWHNSYKPHPVDFDEVRRLCFDAFSILSASRAMAGMPVDEVGGSLHEYFWQTAEPRLSHCFLTIAVRMRTFEDALPEDQKEEYSRLVAERSGTGELGSLGWPATCERVDLSFREACNKIIHSEDFRPTYDNGSNGWDDDVAWGMTGVIEMAGKLGKRDWDVWLTAEEFLATCLEIASYFERQLQAEIKAEK